MVSFERDWALIHLLEWSAVSCVTRLQREKATVRQHMVDIWPSDWKHQTWFTSIT